MPSRLPPALFVGPELAEADPALIASTPEGDYLTLLGLAPSNGALLLPGSPQGAVGFVLPLDDLLDERIETARRLHRLLVRRRPPPASLTAYRRRRLKLALRALDGSLAGADYRAIAKALFGERVPGGAAFRADSLRAQAIRLVRYGVYAAALARETPGAVSVEPAKLVAPMLARFMATDRAFAKARREIAAPPSSRDPA